MINNKKHLYIILLIVACIIGGYFAFRPTTITTDPEEAQKQDFKNRLLRYPGPASLYFLEGAANSLDKDSRTEIRTLEELDKYIGRDEEGFRAYDDGSEYDFYGNLFNAMVENYKNDAIVVTAGLHLGRLADIDDYDHPPRCKDFIVEEYLYKYFHSKEPPEVKHLERICNTLAEAVRELSLYYNNMGQYHTTMELIEFVLKERRSVLKEDVKRGLSLQYAEALYAKKRYQEALEVLKEAVSNYNGKYERRLNRKLSFISDDPAVKYPQPEGIITESVTGMELVPVTGGCYEMGCGAWMISCDQKSGYMQCVYGFWMSRYEVTIEQFREFLLDTGNTDGVNWDAEDCPINNDDTYSLSGNKLGRSGDQPMVHVSWEGAKAYAKWLSRKTGRSFMLPGEYEWEYACRSCGRKEKYAGGYHEREAAWTDNYDSEGRTHKVGGKKPNALGLYDMSGNVWEWCWPDRHNGPPVVRGGSWADSYSRAYCTSKDEIKDGKGANNIGFRLVIPHDFEFYDF